MQQGELFSLTQNFSKVLVMMVLVVGMASMGAGATFIDDFEGCSDGSTPNGWTGSTSSFECDTANPLRGSVSAFLETNGGNNNVVSPSVGGSTKDLTFYIELDSDTGDTADYGQVQAYSSSSNRLGILEFQDSSKDINWYNGNSFVTVQSNFWSVDTTYKVHFDFDFANDEADVIVDGVNYGTYSFANSGNDIDYVDVFNAASNTRKVYVDDIFVGVPNNAPTINSTSVSPDPPLLGENVRYDAEVYDSDGTIQNTTLDVSGLITYNENRTGTTPTWDNLPNPSGEGWLNATYTTYDDAGATATTSIDRYLEDTAPNNPTINNPTGTFNDESIDYNIDTTSDGDSKTGETLTLTLKEDGTQVATDTVTEGGSVTGTFTTSGEGSHNFEVVAEEPDTETSSATSTYSVDFISPTVDSITSNPATYNYNDKIDVTIDASDNTDVSQVCVTVKKDSVTHVSQKCRATSGKTVSETWNDLFTIDETGSTYKIESTVTDNQGKTGTGSTSQTVSNTAPTGSLSATPSTWFYEDNIDLTYSMSDNEGDIVNREIRVFEAGNKIKTVSLSNNSDTINNVFVTDQKSTIYDAQLYLEDSNGVSYSENISQTITDSKPVISLNKPSNKTYYTYDVPVDFSLSDSDRVKNENWNCDINKDSQLYENVYLKEGTNSSYSSTVSSNVGAHNVEVVCSDPASNSDSKNKDYTVTKYKIDSPSSQTLVYETENTTYTVQYTLGNMVNEVNTDLFWSGVKRESRTTSNTGVNTVTLDLYYRPELVNSNNTVKNWEIQSQINYTKFQSSGTATSSKTSNSKSQTVYYAYHSPTIGIASDKVIEKENIDTSLTYTNELNPGPANKTGELTFNGSTATKFDNNFDTPLVPSNSANIDKNASGKLTVSFNGNNRVMTASEDKVTVYKKILTDCSNTVNGKTGTQALNYELRNEENQSETLRGNIDFNFDTTHHGEHNRNYGFSTTNKTNSKVCLYPSWTSYNVTGPLTYSSDKNQNSNNLLYSERDRKVRDNKITNSSEKRLLYLLEDSLSTQTVLKVVDSANNPVQNVKVKTLRYFTGSNSFLTVSSVLTNNDGESSTQLKSGISYKYILSKNGAVIKEVDKQKLICSSVPCTKTFQIGDQISKYFQTEAGFSVKTQKLTDQSGNVTGLQSTVTHDSGGIQNASLKVEKQSVVGYENTCNIVTQSSGQTMVCQFNETLEGNLFKYSVEGTKNGETYSLDSGVLDKTKGLFGKSSPWAAAMIFLVITSLGMVSPKTSIAFGAAGFVVTWWIGLISVSVASVASVVLIAAAVLLTGET